MAAHAPLRTLPGGTHRSAGWPKPSFGVEAPEQPVAVLPRGRETLHLTAQVAPFQSRTEPKDQPQALFLWRPDFGQTPTTAAANCTAVRPADAVSFSQPPAARLGVAISHCRHAGARSMEVTAGPDGFLALSDTFDYAANVILTEHLRERQAAGNAALERALPRLRRELSKSELVGLIRAIHRRIAWIDQHRGELSDPRRWQEFLAQLARNLYSPNLPVAAEDLIALLEGHRKYPALWTFGPEEMLVAFVEANDLTPEFAAELRLFQAELKGQPGSMKYQSRAGYQVAVQHVHMLLWHDGNDPLDRSHCWSEVVRGDLRTMVGERQTRWKSLLRHIKGNAPAKPPKAWLKEAEKRLIAVGQEEFIHELEAWFAPFRSDTLQPTSVAGSHVLRGILWYASLVDDPAVMPFGAERAQCEVEGKAECREGNGRARPSARPNAARAALAAAPRAATGMGHGERSDRGTS